MSNIIYHPTNYRKNLETYWRQYYPEWNIPEGYEVHHIKPQCLFKEGDPAAHHPRNLIALCKDDHYSIHKCRGDQCADPKWIIAGGMTNKNHTKETKLQQSIKMMGNTNGKGRKASEETKRNQSVAMKGNTNFPVKYGKDNPSWSGYYVTPWGTFETLPIASKAAPIKLSDTAVANWCKRKNDSKVSKFHLTKNKGLFAEIDLGKTFKECGYYFLLAGV